MTHGGQFRRQLRIALSDANVLSKVVNPAAAAARRFV
jgi:hypothetical protein